MLVRSGPARMGGALMLIAATLPAPPAHAQLDYNRADMLRIAPSRLYGVPPWVEGLGLGNPEWLDDSTRFRYRIKTPRGAEFIIVDPVKGTRRPLFDNARLAAAMSVAGDTAFDGTKLPFQTVKLLENETAIAFRLGPKRYQCDLTTYRCVKGDTLTTEPPAWAALSPDGKWAATTRQGNLWVRQVAEPGDSIQLTTDGSAEFGYGLGAAERPMPNPDARTPFVVWSPDSKRIVYSFPAGDALELFIIDDAGSGPAGADGPGASRRAARHERRLRSSPAGPGIARSGRSAGHPPDRTDAVAGGRSRARCRPDAAGAGSGEAARRATGCHCGTHAALDRQRQPVWRGVRESLASGGTGWT